MDSEFIFLAITVSILIYVFTKPSPKTNDTLTADDLLAMTPVDLFKWSQNSTQAENQAILANTSPEKFAILNDKIMNLLTNPDADIQKLMEGAIEDELSPETIRLLATLTQEEREGIMSN